ncbi:C2 family cysteine protease [Iningainema tapete]|uniref:Pre-peptidase C-terminal domain-containing protein n=1 Tax=Iningainema tapete BLCC-T55 TaxID=2748662 RepID=A0A8J6XPE2_9CYAN|nr:C2 family cysteine protease [Iningainema tapete]MBD2776831.1 pre-peptidase C-terminal domain-containing protein [Iningainema tapete BLCC-T55]
MPVDYAGNSLGTARIINVTNSSQVFTDYISRIDSNDYYKFSLTGRSSFNLVLNGLTDNVDVRLLNDNGSVIASSTNQRRNAEYVNSTLNAGNYYIQVYRVQDANTYYNLKVSSSASLDWFEQNIQDTGIRAAARSRFADNMIDRNDMIAILRDAKDYGVVDGTELKDLRTLVSNASYLKIPEYVRVLAHKVVNSDPANQKYQGNTLGNLSVGSSDRQMENLINKWFLGGDRPQTPYTYQYASGSLFQNGVSYSDVKQGDMNDCYLLTGLAATASSSPSKIESMFINNGDNTFTVRFYNKGVADYVTVDRYLPTTAQGYFVYANKGDYYNHSSNELWVALAEKAYAQLNESGWIYRDNTNSYNGIGNGGYVNDALAQITGYSTSFGNPINFSAIVNAVNSGQLIGLSTKSNTAQNIVSNHAYALLGYNPASQQFTLFNPWGINNNSTKPGIVQLNWSEIQTSFNYWDGTINRA